MYQEGDKVINSNGVACVIDRIERMKMPHSKVRKNYYVMHDLQKSDNVYYIPQENEETMRSPMTRAEAEGLIDNIPQVDPIDVKFDRFRDEAYRKCMKKATTASVPKRPRNVWSRLSCGRIASATRWRKQSSYMT